MDKRDERFRAWMAERAELITALRFPQGAFEGNSGTRCGADFLIFRRR
jgi:adenine-specific DNA methylase